MTTRPEAIEAGLEAAENDPRWKFDIYPTGWAEVEDVLTIAAPHIESALLDRIEEKVTKRRLSDVSGGWPSHFNDGLDAALGVLSQIREEGK